MSATAHPADWTREQSTAAERLRREAGDVEFVRVAYGDAHGILRSKVLTVPAFLGALNRGLDVSPDVVLIPDPLTFRRMTIDGVFTGLVLADEYQRDGTPHPLSSRRVLKEL